MNAQLQLKLPDRYAIAKDIDYLFEILHGWNKFHGRNTLTELEYTRFKAEIERLKARIADLERIPTWK